MSTQPLRPEANASSYTLHSLHTHESSYGTVPLPPKPSNRRLVLHAALKMAAIFLCSTLFLGTILWLALPTLDEADRPMLRIPKSFQQLQDLNTLLKKYRDIYPFRIVICYITTYLFLQAFSLPGSMYLSILGGAVWGVPRALPLACVCVATGASLSYLISAALGPALLTLPKWKAVLDKWATKIRANKENMISFLILLRIAPLPPHWVVNIVAPHVGIGIVPFWISTALGILGVSVIHTTIGEGLDEMTSADDFHLISWRNFFGLAAVAAGVMIPVGLRYWFRRQGTDVDAAAADEEAEGEGSLSSQEEGRGGAIGPLRLDVRKTREEGLGDSGSIYSSDDDEDVILEAGPSIFEAGK